MSFAHSKIQEAVKPEKTRVVLVSRESPVVDGAQRFCVNRRKTKYEFALHRKNLLAPFGSKTKGKPFNHCGHKACSESSSRYKHFEDDDAKYNTATRLIDH